MNTLRAKIAILLVVAIVAAALATRAFRSYQRAA